MKKFHFQKSVLYTVIAILSLFVLVNLMSKKDNFSLLKTSVVHVLQNIVADNIPNNPDIAIRSVMLKKVASPTYEFNYYRYKATVVLENLGGQLLNSTVTLAANPDQEHVYVRNTDRGFLLGTNGKHIVDNYEVILDGKYNSGEITFNVDVKAKKQKDVNLSNNSFTVSVFEQPAKLENISVKDVLDDGTIAMDFEPAFYYLNENEFSIYTSEQIEIDPAELKYAEAYSENGIFGYYRAKISEEIIKDPRWKRQPVDDISAAKLVKFSDDPFANDKTHYLFVGAKNPSNKNYVFSNLLVIPPQKKLNRADFAKIFIEESGAVLSGKDGLNVFEDVHEHEWFKPYVQSMYNLGLMGEIAEKHFEPAKEISRRDALKIVMDYFDGELKIPEDKHFQDISENEFIFPYAEGFVYGGRGQAMSDYFSADEAAGENFVKYLINEYRKNS